MRTKKLFTILLVLLLGKNLSAQNDSYLISQQSVLSISPLYQRWSIENDVSFSQFASSVSLYLPVMRELSFSLQSTHSRSNGDVSEMSGLSDSQFGVTYLFEKPHIVLSLGVNIPTGKKKLSREEFLTSVLLSNSIFDLQVPASGQGINLHPGIFWAIPASENVVFGVGASYQYRGAFKPLSDVVDYDQYDPGDEILAAFGADLKVAEASTLSGDVVFTFFGSDKLGPEEVFKAGSRLSANVQFTKAFGYNSLWLFGRYRSKSKSDVAVRNVLVKEPEKIEPDFFQIIARYTIRIEERISTALSIEGKVYPETVAKYSGATLFAIGAAPELRLSDTFTLPLQFKYQLGSITGGNKIAGIEAGAGIRVIF